MDGMDEGGLFPAPEIFLHHLILCFPLPQRPQQHNIALDMRVVIAGDQREQPIAVLRVHVQVDFR